MKFVVLIAVALVSTPVFAGKVLLVWNPNPPEENVFGYRTYVAEQKGGPYSPVLDAEGLPAVVGTNRAVLLNVPIGDRYFVVTALNQFGESPFSDEAYLRVTTAALNGGMRLDRSPPRDNWIQIVSETDAAFVALRWGAKDEPGGSGVWLYDIYVTVNGAPFQAWLTGTALTDSVYGVEPGNTYGFYCVASDRAGNRTPDPRFPQAQIEILRNNPPRFEPVQMLVVNAGDLIILTNRVSDADSPPQRHRFALVSSDGPDAKVDPDTGTFFWRPCCRSSARTNYFTISVTDDGTPNLSALQTVAVAVNDYLEMEIGSVVVSQGQDALVPVTVFSSLPSWTLLFTLETPAGTVRETTWRGDPSLVCDSAVLPESPRHWLVGMQSCEDRWEHGRRVVGQFQLQISASRSMFLPLRPAYIAGVGKEGDEIPKVLARPGRVVVIGEEPLLEAQPLANAGMTLHLFGIPGTTYEIQSSSQPTGQGAWQTRWTEMLSTDHAEFIVPVDWGEQLFFRARKVPSFPVPGPLP